MSTGPDGVQALLNKFCSVFDADLTGCAVFPVHLELREEATCKFPKARIVQFFLRLAVETKLDQARDQASPPSILNGRCA